MSDTAVYVPSQTQDIQDLDRELAGIRQGQGYGLDLAASGLRHVACGWDSLTEGAFSTSYLDTLFPRIRGLLGDGGPGYQAFDNNVASATGASWGTGGTNAVSALLSQISGDNVTLTGHAPYSLNRMGSEWAVTSGNEFLNWDCRRNWDTTKIFFLIQPGGGSFRAYSGVGNVVTVSTNGPALALGSVLVSSKKTGGATFTTLNSNLTCDQLGASTTAGVTGTAAILNGPVCLFGAYFLVANAGVACSEIAKGGQFLGSYANLNAAFQATWWSNYSASNDTGGIGPVLMISNGGMNDRATLSAAGYSTALQAVITNVTGNASNRMIVVDTHDSSDALTTNLTNYHAVTKALAKANFLGLVSDRDLFGPYTLAKSAAGGAYLIQSSDGVHPTLSANRMRAAAILSLIGVPSAGPAPVAVSGTALMSSGADPFMSAITQIGLKHWTSKIDCTSAALNAFFPDATLCAGLVLRFVKVDSSANAMTVYPKAGSGQLVSGASSVAVTTQWGTVTGISDGVTWLKF